jgi:hypothetical protein
MKLKLLFVCAAVLLLNVTPVAFGLVVGFNPDIHMDVQGVIANDFHVQGRLESGNWGGNWSNPPVLISHIDGGFPPANFKYSITPDLSDPCGQNWYNFTADWSGTNYPYCSIIHLGLFFDVTCNNVAVNLVGWWTKDGNPIPPNIVPPPINGGAVLIPGFNVQDMPHLGMPQRISLFNHSREGGGGGGGGIYAQIVQMDLVGLTKEELERYLGPIPAAFKELRVGGAQETLPWVQVENEMGPISETNPQPFPVDSFFDVFFDVGFPIHTVRPIEIPPGGFLVARERVRFVNNAGQPEIRWDWMIHGAHESDLGDAPDSTNSFGMPPPLVLMTAYPKGGGGPSPVIAHYPTVYQIGSPPYGPIHWAAPLIAFLGPMVSSETEADIGPDMDPTNNIIPLKDTPDLDNFDDGVIFPIVLPHCQQAKFDYWVNIMPPMPAPMPQTPTLYVNVWFDWNRDGDWDDTLSCPGSPGGPAVSAPEWAVQNQPLAGLPVGLNKITTPQFMPWHPATGDTPPIWMRITLSEQRWAPTAGVLGDGGCGPQYGYIYGETEDYYFVPEVPPLNLDFGDAPEGSNAIAYPATGVTGAFPTCITIGPATWIQHTNFGAWFGPMVDFEGDGNAGLCPFGCFPPYDQDECFADGDAGLIVPLPYTIDAALNVVPCPQCSSGTPLGDTCQTALWGTNIDIDVHNHMPSPATGYVNLLIDWNQDGQWSGSSNCPTAATNEHVLVNFPVPNPYDGPLSALMPFGAGFLIGPNRGYVWARFTITEQPVPVPKPGWNGEGSFEDGETEDYLLEIGKVYEPKPLVEHSKWSQPPIEWNPQSRTPLYCGWDAPSFKEEQGPAIIWQIVADDFRCLGSMPITSIHWWGSYIRWTDENPPAAKPTSWRIGFWSNVPPSPVGGISHPGKLLWQFEVPADRVQENWAGLDQLPDTIPDTCFQYYVQLKREEYFWQAKQEPNTVDSVFWLSIAAIYQPGLPPPNPWGWKTRPWHWMDDAVTFTIAGDFKPGYVPDPSTFHALEYCGQSYDTAFELDTDPNYIKWEQAYTGIRDWPHYEDEESMATVDTVVEPLTKWSQKPDLNPVISIDVDATFSQMPVFPSQVLADDFNCITTGPIMDIYVWGSWLHDALPPGGPQNVLFTLSIHDDLPVGHSQNPKNYSMPGQLQWMRQFSPGDFEVLPYMEIPEGYYMPCTQWYLPQDHFGCWLYHFKLQPGEFTQTGTTTKPVIYWLDVQAMPIAATNPEVRFGWKASEQHWNDDAVFAVGNEPIQVPGPWQKLTYPVGHPYAGRTIDLAFEIVTQKQYEQFNLRRQVADDWRCQSRSPVTTAVWWGSYISYGYEACQCQTTTPRPIKPDYFLLSIWDDVPAATVAAGSSNGVVYVYDTAGNLLWSFNTGANVASVDVSSDGAYIAVGSQGNKLYLFARDGTKLWEKSVPIAYGGWGVGQESKSVAISAYGEYVVAGCTDKLYVYKKDGTLHYSNTGQETCVEISPSGNYIASCNNADGTIHLFSNSVTGGTLLWTKTISNALCIATSDSGYVAVSDRAKVYLYNSAGTQIWGYTHAKWDIDIIRVDMPQDGLSVVAANDDPGDNKGCVLCYWNHLKDGTSGWSATDSTPVWTYDPGGVGSDYYSVAISGNGSYITTGGTQGPCLFASTSNVPLQTYGMGTNQSLDLTDTGFGACGSSQGNLYYFSKDSGIPLWNKALGGNVHAVAVSRGSDPFSHPGEKKWEYKTDKYDEVLVGYDKHPEPGEPGTGGYEPVFRYSVKLPQKSWFSQKDVNEVFWFSVVAVYDQNDPTYPWGWTNHKHVFNDDAVSGYQGTSGGWIWEELYDQTGESADMSFILFTEPGCFPSSYTTYLDWLALGKPNCWCGIYWTQDPAKWKYQCDGDADGLTEGVVKNRVYLNDLNLLIANWKKKIADPTLNPCADIDHKPEGVVKNRVYLADLNIVIANWKKKDAGLPGNCPRPE